MTEPSGWEVCLFRNRKVWGRADLQWGSAAVLAGNRVVAGLPPLSKLPAHTLRCCPSGVVGTGPLRTSEQDSLPGRPPGLTKQGSLLLWAPIFPSEEWAG